MIDFTGILGAGIGAASAAWEGHKNREFQAEANAKNEALMREGWGREDTAVQRQAADMEAAGLSKTLAAGGGASSGSPIRVEPLKSNAGQVAKQAMEGAAWTKNIAQTEAQNKLIAEQTKTQKEIGRKAGIEADKADIELRVEKQLRGQTNFISDPSYVPENDYATTAAINKLRAEGITSSVLADLYNKHWQEINDLEMRLKRAGVKTKERNAAKDDLVVKLLAKELRWYNAKQIGGLVGNITGGLSKTANAAAILNLVGE